jgi:hypothetical protein
VTIAVWTGQRQVTFVSYAAVLFRLNVIDLKWQRQSEVGYQAILAARPGPTPDQTQKPAVQ